MAVRRTCLREQPQHGDVLAAATKQLALPAVDGCADDASPLARAEPRCCVLHFAHRALQVTP